MMNISGAVFFIYTDRLIPSVIMSLTTKEKMHAIIILLFIRVIKASLSRSLIHKESKLHVPF